MAANFAATVMWHVRRNLTKRRLLSFPHLIVLIWLFVLLRGERWLFHWKVEQCKWNKWENWVWPDFCFFPSEPFCRSY